MAVHRTQTGDRCVGSQRIVGGQHAGHEPSAHRALAGDRSEVVGGPRVVDHHELGQPAATALGQQPRVDLAGRLDLAGRITRSELAVNPAAAVAIAGLDLGGGGGPGNVEGLLGVAPAGDLVELPG